MYANRKGWKLTSCNVEVKFIQEDRSAIILDRKLEFVGDFDSDQRKRLVEIADKCPIHEVLTRGAQVQSYYNA